MKRVNNATRAVRLQDLTEEEDSILTSACLMCGIAEDSINNEGLCRLCSRTDPDNLLDEDDEGKQSNDDGPQNNADTSDLLSVIPDHTGFEFTATLGGREMTFHKLDGIMSTPFLDEYVS